MRKLPYSYHSGFYRSVNPGDDLSKPWEGTPHSTAEPSLSPLRPVFNLPVTRTRTPIRSGSSSASSATIAVSPVITVYRVPDPPGGGLLDRIRRFFRLGRKGKGVKAIPEEVPVKLAEPAPYDALHDKVQLHEWKQYGYWAMPYLNDVTIDNIPRGEPVPISTPELRERILALRDANDNNIIRPELWVPGVTHRSLPPRPTRWKAPVPGAPLPFPWEVQLNPLLQHHPWGEAPLRWCIIDKPTYALQGRTQESIACNFPDFAQPATWPFLTHMYFNAVLGDTAPRYPWPFTVTNLKGITVGDVLEAIYREFQMVVDQDERGSWPRVKQLAADRAAVMRCTLMTSLYADRPFVDDMRRCDALGCVMSFRGIEPTIDGSGWMISFGTH